MDPLPFIRTEETKSGKKIILRYPNANDAPLLLEYINTLSAEQTFIRFQGEQLSLDEEIKYLNDFIRKIHQKTAIKILAFHENLLVGIADIVLEDKVSSHVGVFGLTVAQAFRNDRIGSLLAKTAINEAIKLLNGLEIITLGVFSNNPIAYSLYQKMGFIEYGRLPRGVKYKGTFVDHIFMYKPVL